MNILRGGNRLINTQFPGINVEVSGCSHLIEVEATNLLK